MAEDDNTQAETAGGEQGTDADKTQDAAPSTRRRLVRLSVVLSVLLAVGGGAYWFLWGPGAKYWDNAKEEEEDSGGEGPFFVDLQEMLINIDPPTTPKRYLKTQITLEVGRDKAVKTLESNRARINDTLQSFFRELTLEDLRGAYSLNRIADEAKARINQIIEPRRVRAVLFQSFVIQ